MYQQKKCSRQSRRASHNSVAPDHAILTTCSVHFSGLIPDFDSLIDLFGSDLLHSAGVRGVTGSGGRIGNNDVLEVVLGDSADCERVCCGASANAQCQGSVMQRTNANSETKDGQTCQGILDDIRLTGTVKSGGGPVVLVVVGGLRYSAVALVRDVVEEVGTGHSPSKRHFGGCLVASWIGGGDGNSHVRVNAKDRAGWRLGAHAFHLYQATRIRSPLDHPDRLAID